MLLTMFITTMLLNQTRPTPTSSTHLNTTTVVTPLNTPTQKQPPVFGIHQPQERFDEPPPPQPSQSVRRVGDNGVPAGTALSIVQPHNQRQLIRCTNGFTINDVNGQPWAITAGHCGNVGDMVYAHDDPTQHLPSKPVGVVHSTGIIPGGGPTTPSRDWAAIKLDVEAPLEGVMGLSTGVPTIVSFDLEHQPGDQVCKWGSTTGETCGVVTGNNVTVNASGEQGDLFLTTSEAVMCSQRGDSGGPVYNQNYIVGVLSSTTVMGDRPCGEGDKTEYTPTGVIVHEMNVQHPGLFNWGVAVR